MKHTTKQQTNRLVLFQVSHGNDVHYKYKQQTAKWNATMQLQLLALYEEIPNVATVCMQHLL